MYIHEVIIDGFKSYAQRTVVSGFDPQFNAITGLNGTGKSNILDSICFVLGISNLSQVRVGNLQELVYKQGQAGVTKASVTIVFNNSDTATSPVGYESHKQITVTRQVVIGGKNKYMINGHTVQQSQIQNLFHSVQLNVNNPHFLIMQGRITKVLNMKPEETLSMIEEAAGTRMFETKKQAALKTIEKKQLKVEELTKCMDTEITPTLESLRGERQSYMQWQADNSELERLERFCVASEYQACDEKVQSSEADKKVIVDEHSALLSLQKSKEAEAEQCDKKVRKLENDRDEDTFQELKKRETELSKELVKVTTLANNHKDSLKAEQQAHSTLSKQIDALGVSVQNKENELQQANADLQLKEAEVSAADNNAASMREKYQNACAGMADDTNAEVLSLPEQVAVWEKRMRETQSQEQQGALRSEHLRSSLKELRKSAKEQEKKHEGVIKESDAFRKQIEVLEGKLSQQSYSEAEQVTMRSRRAELQVSTSALKDKMNGLSAQLEARLAFEFKDPVKGFDRTKVKGLVAKLVRVNDKRATTALEIVAGAKLYNVIVDTEETGKQLLQKGALKKRVTILPLNKIASRCTDPAKVAAAKAIASKKGGNANLAIELVGYDDELRRAMEHVFGNTIICDNPAIAKEIAFDKNVRNKTVTLEGDSYDPSGTLTGGSQGSLGVLLGKIEELALAQESFNKCSSELKVIESHLIRAETEANTMKDAIKELDLKKHALKMVTEKMADSSYAQVMNEIASLEVQVAALETESVALKAAHENAKEELKKLKNTEQNAKKQREKAMKDFENRMKDAQKIASSVKVEATVLRNKRDAVAAEVVAAKKELSAVKDQLSISEKGVAKMVSEEHSFEELVSEKRAQYDDLKEQVLVKQQELNEFSSEIKALEALKEKCLKAAQNASLDARKIEHKLKQWEKDCKDAAKAIQVLLKQHPWIEKERGFFGQPGSDYDFKSRDVVAGVKRLKDIKDSQEKLSKKINKKVMGMIEKAESEYEELARKRDVILNDKSKIEAVIDELDVKKSQALQTTWSKVNRDFGSIFSTLLPGVTAKLDPLEGKSVADGLEVKVAFNGVWKESLTELSGGQRSLLALSLILSLLLFKPAPMYILDEVDAALDLSHTQNIGLMLRTHFSASQFIVVSLKEGMFNNANVIFRTKFVDGISAVQRTVVGGNNRRSLLNDQENEDGNGAVVAPSKKKGKAAAKRGGGAIDNENMIEA